MDIHFHVHAIERMKERGATEEEVIETIKGGEVFSAKFSRSGFRRNFSLQKEWRGIYYNTKQIEAYAVKEDNVWLILTVITRYF